RRARRGRTYRLGVLLPHPRDVPVNAAFLDEFRHLGFIEGQNLTEWRPYWLHFDPISQYAAELVNARVDVITTGGDEGIRALQHATKTIPNRCDHRRYAGVRLRELASAAGRQHNRG